MFECLRKTGRALGRAWFLDIPFLIDSRWRHIEYVLNAECCYQPGVAPTIAPRSFWRKPPFWFFVLTVLYVAYGPTWGGLCALLPGALRKGIGIAILFGSVGLGVRLLRTERNAIRRRFEAPPQPDEYSPLRHFTVWSALVVGIILLTGIGIGAGYYVWQRADQSCAIAGEGWRMALQVALCLAAVGLFALAARWARGRADLEIYAQVAILAGLAFVQWKFLATAAAREADHVPYRHLFAFWAPCIVAVVALAPALAGWIFQCGDRVDEPMRSRMRALLEKTELFVNNRTDPALSGPRIFYAVVHGPLYHLLHLLLLPSLVALTASAETLTFSVAVALFISAMILLWGSISSRWQELVIYLERWFLRGAPLLVSVFVIVVGVLRVLQFGYVSTLLDAAPFGTTFSLVAMLYILFWLTEYWLGRVVATRLLDILGPRQDPYRISYPFPLDPLHPPVTGDPNRIQVNRNHRYLVSHGTGRFVALGTYAELDGPPLPDAEHPVRTFQPYYLIDLFSRLGERTGVPDDHEKVLTINRLTSVYYFGLNALMLLITAGFAYLSWSDHYGRINGIDPVATLTTAPPPASMLVDLPRLLLQPAAQPDRPAIVVIGSGGGTRAALYTASVLHGLHCLGVDGDIVMLSGVSGGGVALAYFDANRDALIKADADSLCKPPPPPDKKPPPGPWTLFSTTVTEPFIEDVLDGATEWRIFRTTSLSMLLSESFTRRVFDKELTFGTLKKDDSAPALILNSTMAAHPEEESRVLARTLDPYPDPDPRHACGEAERVFKLMSGGRVIYTNLKDVGAFPTTPAPDAPADVKQPIPDVRLPYQIVRAPNMPLATAAALNANFPPVFPDARLRITGAYPKGGCRDRSLYVTDGGVEENLGLISALYALKSALASIQQPQQQPQSQQRVRPIYVVIAEASAVGYDFSNDRGVSLLFGGGSVGLTGGLTNELIADVDRELGRLNGKIEYHYLPLPLAFRTRGGFGTHWLYAQDFHLNDPRPRKPSSRIQVPLVSLGSEQAVLNREQLEEIWNALHVRAPFCERKTFGKSDMDKVRTWICGADGAGRDLHLDGWKRLVAALGEPRTH